MIKKDSVNTLRLKYKSRFVTIRLTYGDNGLAHIEVIAPVAPIEKSSFVKIASTISKLVYAGVQNRSSILGKLDRMVGVDYDVLSFMKKVVRDHLKFN